MCACVRIHIVPETCLRHIFNKFFRVSGLQTKCAKPVLKRASQ